MGIGGHSAGANLATVTCLRDLKAQEFQFKYQVLDYPPLDLATDPYKKPAPKGSIPPRMAAIFNLCYVDPEKAKDPSVSPVFAAPENLAGMPRALVIVCGGDSLHDEGVRYAELLQAAGTGVKLHDFPGEKHGFTYNRTAGAREAIKLMTEFIRENAHEI